MTDERYIRGEIRVWQIREDPNVIEIALRFNGFRGDLRTTVENEARPRRPPASTASEPVHEASSCTRRGG